MQNFSEAGGARPLPVPGWRIPQRLEPAMPFPPYRYIPGQGPHPVSHPDGHSYGRHEIIEALTSENYSRHRHYRFGFDLFNSAYWWEAHENWEGVWHVTADDDLRQLLMVLIQLSAAFLKTHIGQESGVVSFCRRIGAKVERLIELFEKRSHKLAGVDLNDLRGVIQNLHDNRRRFMDTEYLYKSFPTLVPTLDTASRGGEIEP